MTSPAIGKDGKIIFPPKDFVVPVFNPTPPPPEPVFNSNNDEPYNVPANIKNDCTPQRIYGGYRQFLFMGCSVSSFTTSIGIDGQVGELTVQIVEDHDSCLQKVYFDSNLEEQTMTGPDPGFITPVEGAPYYFRVEDFEYCGILQSWTKNDGQQGKNVYTIKLTDPTPILEGVKLVLSGSGYVDSVNGLPNIINVYGFCEAFGEQSVNAPLTQYGDVIFGSPADAIGGSEDNDTGMPVDLMLLSLSVLISTVPEYKSIYNSAGRIVGPGSPPNLKYGALNPDKANTGNVNYPYSSHYLIDFSNFPLPPEYYRIKQQDISVLDLITQIATEGGYSFYIELTPIRYNGKLYNVIKPRLISKLYLGQHPNSIDEFLTENPNATVRTYGREFRNEPTSSLVIGGNRESIYQSTQIQRYFGLDGNNNVRQIFSQGGYEYVWFDISKEIPGLNTTTIRVYLKEMEAAAQSQEAFETMTYDICKTLGVNSLNFGYYLRAVDSNWVSSFDMEKLEQLYSDFLGGRTVPIKKAWGIRYENNYFERSDTFRGYLESAFNFVSEIGNTYCGKQFLIPLPYTATKVEQVQGLVQTTETPCESGWSEDDYILGVNRTFTTVFSDENSKVRAFAMLNNVLYDVADTENYLLYTNAYRVTDTVTRRSIVVPVRQKYVECTSQEEIVYSNFLSKTGPYAVIQFASPICTVGSVIASMPARELREKFGGSAEDIQQFALKMQGSDQLNLMTRTFGVPLAVALPVRNNYVTYGPWSYTGAAGNAYIERDESLTPWDYGSTELMELAGQNKANSVAVNTQSLETGTLGIPGYPAISIGAELLSNGASTIETRTVIIKNDDKTTDAQRKYVTVNNDKWTGLKGPNITNLSCEVGANGITTNYEMRSYTAVYGRFNRYLFDRIKLLGQQTRRIERSTILRTLNFKFTFDKQSDFVKSTILRMAATVSPLAAAALDASRKLRSPGNVIIGNIYSDSEETMEHADIGIHKASAVVNEITTNGYQNKAMMSLDGILRPVSRKGSGSLPRLPQTATAKAHSKHLFPPIDGSGSTYYPIKIRSDNLDPVQAFHDIEIVSMGTQAPRNGNSMYNEGRYAADARFIAFKGPMVMTGYGYDTDNKPIPNEKDVGAISGDFAKTGLTDNFAADAIYNSRKWPVGPIDLRWDRTRGVWTNPQPYRLVICQITEENPNFAQQRDDQGLDFTGDPPDVWYGEGDDIYELDFNPRINRKTKYAAKILNKSTADNASGVAMKSPEIYVHLIDKKIQLDIFDKCIAYYDTVEEKYFVIEKFSDNKIYIGKVVGHGLNMENDTNIAIADVEVYSDDFNKPKISTKSEDDTTPDSQLKRPKVKVHFLNVRPFSFPFTMNQKISFAKVNGIFVALGDYCTPFRFAIGRILTSYAGPLGGYLVQYSMNAPNEAYPSAAYKAPFGGSFGEFYITDLGTEVGSNNPTGYGYTPLNLTGFAHNFMDHPLSPGALVYMYLDDSCIPERYSGEGGSAFDPPAAMFFILRSIHGPVCAITNISLTSNGGGQCGGRGVSISTSTASIVVDTVAFPGGQGQATITATSKVCENVEYECCSSKDQNGNTQNKTIDKGKFRLGTDLNVQGQAARCF